MLLIEFIAYQIETLVKLLFQEGCRFFYTSLSQIISKQVCPEFPTKLGPRAMPVQASSSSSHLAGEVGGVRPPVGVVGRRRRPVGRPSLRAERRLWLLLRLLLLRMLLLWMLLRWLLEWEFQIQQVLKICRSLFLLQTRIILSSNRMHQLNKWSDVGVGRSMITKAPWWLSDCSAEEIAVTSEDWGTYPEQISSFCT